MLYYYLAPLAREFRLLNLFNYITFRAAGATVTAILLAFFVGPAIIRRLKGRNVGQVVRADGPASHQSKRGTPTMGGLIILVSTLVPTVLWARWDNQRFVIVAVGATLWMGLIARYKLVGQVTFGVVLGLYLLSYPIAVNLPANATTLPFFKYVLVLLPSFLYLAFVTFVITATSNAVNLTDGLDGLATGLTVIAAAAFAVFAYLFGRVDAAEYLRVYYLRGAGELSVFSAALMGANNRRTVAECFSQ